MSKSQHQKGPQGLLNVHELMAKLDLAKDGAEDLEIEVDELDTVEAVEPVEPVEPVEVDEPVEVESVEVEVESVEVESVDELEVDEPPADPPAVVAKSTDEAVPAEGPTARGDEDEDEEEDEDDDDEDDDEYEDDDEEEEEDDDDDEDKVRWQTTGSVGPAMIVAALSLIAVYAVPALEFARPLKPDDPVPFWNLIGRPFDQELAAEEQERNDELEDFTQEVLAADDPPPPKPKVKQPVRVVQEVDAKVPEYEPQPGDEKPAVQALELFRGDELDRFYGALARSDASLEGAITRVVHWGDSAIGIDGIPGAIRRRMQTRFGDSGHGFHAIAQPNTSYRHREVEFRENKKWGNCFIIFKCREDGRYGLGGVTSRSIGGAQSSFAPSQKHSSGLVSKFELWYAAQPAGGQLRVRVDKGEKQYIKTANSSFEDRWETFEVEDGYHELEVRAAGGGKVRVYGVTMEREVPGVVWDSLALVGAFTKRLGELDEDHLRGQLSRRQADLAVFTFGGNDMIRKISMQTYIDEYRAVVQKVRRARPAMDCLVMAPLDHGERKGARIVSRDVVPRMVEAQRQVAEAEGCAFFDTFQAMGGEGSAGRWYKRSPRLIGGDLSHATSKGHQVIGELVYRALLRGYVDFRERTDGTDAAPPAKPPEPEPTAPDEEAAVKPTDEAAGELTDEAGDEAADEPTDEAGDAADELTDETGDEARDELTDEADSDDARDGPEEPAADEDAEDSEPPAAEDPGVAAQAAEDPPTTPAEDPEASADEDNS